MRRKRKLKNQLRIIIKNKKPIHDRPAVVNEQSRIGDFETDLVKCKNGYIVTITERKSLFNYLAKVKTKDGYCVQQAITKALQNLGIKVRTITSDNGTEFANHEIIATALETTWYFTDAYKSQQRGCNENQNGLIRQYLKNDTDLDEITENELNNIKINITTDLVNN